MANKNSIEFLLPMSNALLLSKVKNAISADRMSTFEAATRAAGDGDQASLKLYIWNAQVSAALLPPLHICEVVVRNALAEALEGTYGNRWPWERPLELSLPDPAPGFSPRRDLIAARRRASTPGKVIPELKFAFWQSLLTRRHDQRLWNVHLKQVLPYLDSAKTIAQWRQALYQDLEQVRQLRNRIAHHEPIFTRNLADDFQRIVSLIEFRCKVTAGWMVANQHAVALIAAKP
jgi:hypothetical protein